MTMDRTSTEELFTHERNDYAQREALLDIQASTQDGVVLGVKLAQMYQAYAQRRGWSVHEIWPHPIPGSTRSAMHGIWRIAAGGAYAELKNEDGVHQLHETRVTADRPSLQRCSATVAVLPGAEPMEVECDPEQVRIDLIRHAEDPDLGISRFDTVTRLTHLPTA